MLVIGSMAMSFHGVLPEGRKVGDADYIGTMEEFQAFRVQMADLIARCVPQSEKSFHIRLKSGFNVEFEIAHPGSSGMALLEIMEAVDYARYADLGTLLALKLSHRYRRNSPHFLKTMRDIQHLRSLGANLNPELEVWLPHRERETYVYSHPKLNVNSKEFFSGDGVNYKYEHDSIHEAVALIETYAGYAGQPVAISKPAYTYYMQEGSEVMTSKEKFFSVPESVRLFGVYEESCVLALERSQIPHAGVDDDFWCGDKGSSPSPRWSFCKALEKVCTSITSGWFREYAWENYDKVMALYEQQGESDYIVRFKRNKHMLLPYKGEGYAQS